MRDWMHLEDSCWAVYYTRSKLYAVSILLQKLENCVAYGEEVCRP
jgi:hypothetical protein